jgi:cytochrome b561
MDQGSYSTIASEPQQPATSSNSHTKRRRWIGWLSTFLVLLLIITAVIHHRKKKQA